MTTDQLVLIVGVGLLALGALCAGLAAAWVSGRRYAGTAGLGAVGPGALLGARQETSGGSTDGELDAPRRSVRDLTLRSVALLFLVAVALVVAVSGRWPDAAPIIYALVALGTFAVVLLGDLLPSWVPEGLRGWAQAVAAIIVLTILVGLTDGLESPFMAGFFLLVGAAALSRDGMAPIVLALVAASSAAAVGLLVANERALQGATLSAIAFQTLALLLLAAVSAVAGREQRRARDAALRLARFDPLTGLYNRAHFFAELERELRLAQRAGRSFALLMVDLDGLKPINDTFGHQSGDRMLQAVTQVIHQTVRSSDTAARYGGDEFVLLLPDTDATGAYVVAEKLRRDIAALSIQVSDRAIRTSVSIGLVAYPEDGSTVEGLMAAADAALYEAKRGGRDRIVGYTTRTERVATRMGAGERAVDRHPPADTGGEPVEPLPPPSPPGPAAAGGGRAGGPTGEAPWSGSSSAGPAARSARGARPAQPRGRAPWETITEPPVGAASRERVVVPVGPADAAPPEGTGRPSV